jgi:thioredoxin-related protein
MNPIRNIFSIILLIFLSQNSISQKQTLFLDKDFDAAMEQAKLEQKPVVLMFYASWCVHCNKMKNEVFTNQDVINFYTKNYICIASDIESNEGKLLREKLRNQLIVKSFPTFCFFDFNQKVTNCIAGEFKPEVFIKEGLDNLDANNHFQSIKSKFENDYSNYDNCFSYILLAKRIGANPTEIAQKYLKTVAPKDYYTEQNWKLIANGIIDFNTPEFIDIVNNRSKFENVVSKKRVEKKINFVINDNFSDFIAQKDTLNYSKNRKIAAEFKNKTIDSLLFHQDLSLYERTFQWNKYHKILEENMAAFGLKDDQFINNVCANYFVYIVEIKMLESAISWEKVALKINPSLDKYVLLSNLLLKSKNYKEAIEFATKGKEFAENLGFNTTEIENILTEIKSKSKK